MLINYVPAEECRVAIVEDGKLEELHVERFANASRVGNIYVGRVTNVEPAIQAAFIDFGVGENGFLHITDLHPRYFPGESDDATERVGLKTPRRERPLIQHALKRGQEVIVQVLKEGVGTKGPTLTGYLSIPGRFLVMMPYMDRVGVSRKVEDEDQRRQMREILDQLDLPEGFGFILRTAGFSRNKTELKRDLAYLQRLWKDMEKRLKAGGKPRLLYTESDLLVRALRDILSGDIDQVVIDNEAALRRAARFMKIVAPRGGAKLMHYPAATPLFHAFGVEKQISLIHAREVPLPSGGRLVIDQTEALVAIDVNSGRSRDSRDAETNAYQTNIEAVDEICRQLRLRDLGGIVINDLIDMRKHEHRKDIENRFKDRLKRDRAKTTVLSISDFGILEMTRQRMRASHESTHFTDCPTCRGRGVVQKPDSIASDALRELASILDLERVRKIELAVAPRVAGELLSHKRQLLGRIERQYGKHVDVRVSETVPIDRVSFYAYDENGADIDVMNMPTPRPPRDLVAWTDPTAADAEWAGDPEEEARQAVAEDAPEEVVEDLATHPIEIDDVGDESDAGDEGEGGRRRKRRRRRGGRGGEGAERGDAPQARPRRPAAEGDSGEPGPQRERGAAGRASGEAERRSERRSERRTRRGRTQAKRRRRRRGRGTHGEGQPMADGRAGPEGARDSGAPRSATMTEHPTTRWIERWPTVKRARPKKAKGTSALKGRRPLMPARRAKAAAGASVGVAGAGVVAAAKAPVSRAGRRRWATSGMTPAVRGARRWNRAKSVAAMNLHAKIAWKPKAAPGMTGVKIAVAAAVAEVAEGAAAAAGVEGAAATEGERGRVRRASSPSRRATALLEHRHRNSPRSPSPARCTALHAANSRRAN